MMLEMPKQTCHRVLGNDQEKGLWGENTLINNYSGIQDPCRIVIKASSY